MRDNYKVSVIVPVYNTEKYIHRCVDSLIHQTYSNLEIILVDDGSTDASGKICDDYGIQDTRVKVIHQQNGGQGTARNAGLDVAKGDYIAFVDSDDYVAVYMYEMVTDIFKRKKADIVCFKLHAGTEEGFIFPEKDDSVEVTEGIKFLRNLYDIKDFDSIVLKVYRKELFDDIRFSDGRTMGEDVGVLYRLVYKAKKIAMSKLEAYYYFQSPNSTMRGAFSIDKAGEYISFKERLQFFKEIGESKLYERALLQYEAVILRNYYYIRKFYHDKNECLSKIKLELLFVKKQIKKGKMIPLNQKIIYIVAAFMPYLSGFAVNKLLEMN